MKMRYDIKVAAWKREFLRRRWKSWFKAENALLPCRVGAKHFQSYMRTRQKCNPEYIPLYLRSETNSICGSWPAVLLNGPCRRNGKLRKFRGHWIVRMIWAIERSASILRTTQFSKRIKMVSQVHFDLENFFRIKIINVSEETSNFNMRVWSWLRMNAGGVPNTCKSNGTILRCFRTDLYSLVADGWVTRGQPAFHRGIAAGNGW